MTVGNSARPPHPYPYLSLGAPRDSNPRPSSCQAGALSLPSFFFFAHGQSGDRSTDLLTLLDHRLVILVLYFDHRIVAKNRAPVGACPLTITKCCLNDNLVSHFSLRPPAPPR